MLGFPIRISTDRSLVGSSPWLFAATHVLHRLQAPRHPPLALCSLENKDARARYEVLKPHKRRRSRLVCAEQKAPATKSPSEPSLQAVGAEGAGIAFPDRTPNAAPRKERHWDVPEGDNVPRKRNRDLTSRQTARPTRNGSSTSSIRSSEALRRRPGRPVINWESPSDETLADFVSSSTTP